MTAHADGASIKHPRSLSNKDMNGSTAQEPSPTQRVRPSVAKLWQTDRPVLGANLSSAPPQMARHATNLPTSEAPMWHVEGDGLDDNSSSSSSEDEAQTKRSKRLAGWGREPTPGREQSEGFSRFNIGNDEYKTKGKVSKRDGRLNISVNETSNKGYLAKALGANFIKGITGVAENSKKKVSMGSDLPPPTLNIVVMVIGSRGDIQPFLKLGKDLKEFGHRVRIATHPAFKEFVEKDSELEFFSVGGDPAELMAFMVKNPGMIPTMDTIKTGEIGRRRDQMAEMFHGFWRACINGTDDEKDVNNLKMLGANMPFVADAIIANPPSFAHMHCAERLGIPLHLMFTFPYTPTQSFPHPLANIKQSNVDPGYTNFMSYPLVEMMTWQGLGDLVNDFRVRTLGLEPVSTLWAPGQLYRQKVPYTYLWSPGLVPKPKDWGPEIDIAGFVFLDLASKFKPPKELQAFLDAGQPPVYIGFGSIVVDEPDKFTKMIFEAVEKAGVRALVSKGWGGLGDDDVPDNVFMLENTPHDWLFPKVSAVVHHGGAGTTAIGLKCGKPTMVVPFFGDQQFWGAMIHEAGAGAAPIPYKQLSIDNLANGIKECLTEEVRKGVQKIAASIEEEGDSAKNAVASFHRSLVTSGPLSMRCSMLEERVAVWMLKNTHLRLSALAAELLVEQRKITWRQLRLIRHNEWNDFVGPGEPITGLGHAAKTTVIGVTGGVGSVPFKLAKSAKKRASREEKMKRRSARIERNKKAGIDTAAKRLMDQEEVSHNNGVTSEPNGSEEKPTVKSETTIDARNHDPKSSTQASKHTITGQPIKEHEDEVTDEDYRDTLSGSIISEQAEEHVVEDIAQDVGTGVQRTLESVAMAPLDLSVAIAQGFHNAPRLYGDTTVRKPTRITGIKSGLKAARQEFAYGVYDGVTGLVLQPYNGARDNGAVGFIKGVGMGLTGFILKDVAAIFGPFAYTAKGLQKQFTRHKQPTSFIRKARIMQGHRDIFECSHEEQAKVKQTVAHGWDVIQQFWDLMDQTHGQRLTGKIARRKERDAWKSSGAFENVKAAEKALEIRRKGESLDEVFKQQAKQKAVAEIPKHHGIRNIQKGEYAEDAAVKEPHSGVQN
ncbi:hypothetical protein BJ878DRAFT_510508 [Calycina marina]|uniref:Glycosyltransferase family 28 N-terminal domain-containing protein n=1 Tax=Calycina marina TaxID=1763456 RepID=A0A9P7Z137_9HELO|nr:hypothetical protein BJ878DRAFT_510508 [Calycina marina]